MAFDLNEFRTAAFEDRTEILTLNNFGDEKESVGWKVRALTAEDLARIEEEVELNKSLPALLSMVANAVSQGSDKQRIESRIESVKEILGISGKVPDVLVKQYVIFERGTVDFKFDRADTIKFAKCYPIEFTNITNRILTLTGLGAVKKKPSACGTTTE